MGRRGLYFAIAGAGPAAAFALAAVAAPTRHFADNSPTAVPVDVELVIAVDVSYSMDPDEQALQREGYIMALTSRKFMQALRQGMNGYRFKARLYHPANLIFGTHTRIYEYDSISAR
jgi:hypothetical protein